MIWATEELFSSAGNKMMHSCKQDDLNPRKKNWKKEKRFVQTRLNYKQDKILKTFYKDFKSNKIKHVDATLKNTPPQPTCQAD